MDTPRHKPSITLTAIAAITILEALAIHQGFNGLTFQTSLAAISGLAGFTLGRLLRR